VNDHEKITAILVSGAGTDGYRMTATLGRVAAVRGLRTNYFGSGAMTEETRKKRGPNFSAASERSFSGGRTVLNGLFSE